MKGSVFFYMSNNNIRKKKKQGFLEFNNGKRKQVTNLLM